MVDLKHVDTWRGQHRGVSFSIKKHETDHPCWAHYIQLHENQIPESHKKKVFLARRTKRNRWVWYDYTESLVAGLDWHYGITYYEYLCSHKGHRVIEAGCDYSHLWDEEAGYQYDLDWVVGEAKRTIDSLFRTIPDMHTRCSWNGKYYPVEDMIQRGNGYISKEGEKQREARAEARKKESDA